MTTLVCGASGILGNELCTLLHSEHVNYIATYNTNKINKGIQVDFLNVDEIRKTIQQNAIDVCVNCIVERQVNICETEWEKIKLINVTIAKNIATVCAELDVHFIHISTDYVFDGKHPPYYPDSQVNPLQNYGISKLLSEYKVASYCKAYSIIRVPVLYSDKVKNIEDSAVTLIGKKILDRRMIHKEDNYSIRRPNFIADLCPFILKMIHEKPKGIYHFCNPHDKVTKYEIASIIADYLGKTNNTEPINIEPNDGIERPTDTLLMDNKYNIENYNFTPLTEGIQNCFKKLYHPTLNADNAKNIFFMIDLDGTLIASDILHYNAYKTALNALYMYELMLDEYNKILTNEGMDKFIKKTFGDENYEKIKANKNKQLKSIVEIDFVKNAKLLIDYIDKYNVNHVVVTNTSKENVSYFKSILPDLRKLKNWVVREDYSNPKPSPDGYVFAKDLYYQKEEFIIGIENTQIGYQSVKQVTDCVYMVVDGTHDDYTNYIKHQDVYMIDDFDQLFQSQYTTGIYLRTR